MSDESDNRVQITAIDVRNFQRIEELHVDVPGDRRVMLVAGKNGAGKSSLLDAVTAALGGADELRADPIRRGAERAPRKSGSTICSARGRSIPPRSCAPTSASSGASCSSSSASTCRSSTPSGPPRTPRAPMRTAS